MATSMNHAVEIIQIPEFLPHTHADNLAVVNIFGFTVVVHKESWKPGDLAAYIPPDSVVPDTPDYAFLKGHFRIRAKKLRGVISFGLLMPAPTGSKIGDDVAEIMGITHYQPEEGVVTGGEAIAGPPGFVGSKFDVENLRRYPGVIPDGTLVQITEKIHGACGRFTYRDGRIYTGSRTEWKDPEGQTIWARVCRPGSALYNWCKSSEGYVIYGEVFGNVQSLKYGVSDGVRFAAFDISRPDGVFLNPDVALAIFHHYEVPSVPLLSSNKPYDFDTVVAMAEGDSCVPCANHVREGCVVRPMEEMWDQRIGRVILKAIGGGYLLLKG